MNVQKRINDYKDLLVWQKGVELVQVVYRLTQKFPHEEKFGIITQMRRAAVSIPSNIAEGQIRRSTREFAQFLSHAEGSAAELETQLIIAGKLNYCAQADIEQLMEQVLEMRKMLHALRRNLVKNLSR